MKLMTWLIRGLAVFYLVLGISWFYLIQLRCEEISPRPVFNQAVMVPTLSAVSASKPADMVRSPHAKDYHLILFWVIAMVEVFVAAFYVVAGIFMLQRYALVHVFALGVLWTHFSFVILVVGYMKLCAEPLARLTHNTNVLQLYFMPSGKIHSVLTSYLNGYKFFTVDNITYIIFCGCYFLLSLALLKHSDTKKILAQT